MKTQKDKLDQHLYWIFTVGYVSEHRKNVLIKGLCDLFSWVYKKTSASSSDQTLYHKADQKDILFTFIWMNFNLLSFKQTSSVLLTLQKDAVISVPSCITHTNYHCTPSRLFHEPWPALHISDLCHAWHNLLCSHMMPCASNRPSRSYWVCTVLGLKVARSVLPEPSTELPAAFLFTLCCCNSNFWID